MPMLPFWNMAVRTEALKGLRRLSLEQRPIAVAGLTGENSEEATGSVHDGGWFPSELVGSSNVERTFKPTFHPMPEV